MAYISFQPSDNFSTKLYNGNNSTQSITGVGFQPDLTWLKSYDTAGTWHYLTDSVRGVGKQLYSNSDSSQGSNPAVITAFDSDGFSLGDASDTNGSGVDCVAWSWKAGTTTGIAGSPSITPSLARRRFPLERLRLANSRVSWASIPLVQHYAGGGRGVALVAHDGNTVKHCLFPAAFSVLAR